MLGKWNLVRLAAVILVASIWSITTMQLGAVNQKLEALTRLSKSLVEQSMLLSPADMGNHRIDIRVFMINSQVAQALDPIVIVGDSLTEAALLPSTICGHPVVNAGIGGGTPSNYARIIKDKGLFADMRAALAIVALGTNSAQTAASLSEFEPSYRELLTLIEGHTSRIALVEVPPIGAGDVGKFFDASRVPQLNAVISKIADGISAPVVTIPDHLATVDGVHLSASGYKGWLRSVENGANAALHCAPTAQTR